MPEDEVPVGAICHLRCSAAFQRDMQVQAEFPPYRLTYQGAVARAERIVRSFPLGPLADSRLLHIFLVTHVQIDHQQFLIDEQIMLDDLQADSPLGDTEPAHVVFLADSEEDPPFLLFCPDGRQVTPLMEVQPVSAAVQALFHA